MGLYDDYSREELIQKIEAEVRLKKELLRHVQDEEQSEYVWSGNLGHWFWDYQENQVTFNFMKAGLLGYKKQDIPDVVPIEFFTKRIHPEDYERVVQKLRDHLEGRTPVWEAQYRIQANDGTWKTYFDQGKVTQKNEAGQVVFLKGIVFDITDDNIEKQEWIKRTTDLSERVKTDGLTQLSSRATVMYKLAKHVKEAKEKQQPLFIVFLDIDHLRQQNELYGPMLGDEIIRTTGSLIRSKTRNGDVVGRYSSEKFLVVLPNTDEQAALEIANNIRLGLQKATFSQPAEATLSGSVVRCEGDETLSQLIQKAEESLYAAKKNGRNRIEKQR